MAVIPGMSELIAKLQAIQPTAKAAAGRELYQFAEDVMEISKTERVPVDTGALMGSGHVDDPVEDGDRISVTMGYGDDAVDYAVIVHEMMDVTYTHGGKVAHAREIHWTRPGSGPKYLQNPLTENQDSLPGRVAEAVKKDILG